MRYNHPYGLKASNLKPIPGALKCSVPATMIVVFDQRAGLGKCIIWRKI
jgi:hypothetical protein